MLLLLASLVAFADDVSTGALDATLSGDQLSALVAGTGESWLSAPSEVYDLGGAALDADLQAEALPDGQLLLRLVLSNPGADDLQADLVFPDLSGLGTGSSDDLGYFFPALGPILDDEISTHRRYHGALFPLQVMEIHQGSAGLWLMTRDLDARAKTYNVGKSSDGRGSFAVEWPGVVVSAGASVTLEASLGAHDSDWHEALAAYRRWVRTWYQPRARPKDPFRQAFNLRQLHLHDNSVLGAHPGAFDHDSGTFSIQDYLAEDAAALGGVDWVHIFDWGMDWVHGRAGDYNPWSYLGEPSVLQGEIDALQDEGVGVGLYVEGYLLDTPSLVGLSWGDDWELQDSSGEDYTSYAPSWHTCPGVADWQEHSALRNGRRTELRVGASGLYVDQHGYGYQYPCYRSDHDHDTSREQLIHERDFMAQLRTAMSPDQVLYTEAAPIDVTSQWQDGAFTEAVSAYRNDSRTVPITMRRFALPLSKTFELLTQDAPLGDDVEGVRLAFFNGEGTRHMGYLDDDPWFDDATLDEIAHAWSVLRTWRAAFTSLDPVPLVDTTRSGVVANLFPADGDRLWTVLNRTEAAVSGQVLAIDTVPDATWWDCWNDVELVPEVVDGVASIELSLDAGAVGCVVESRPVASPELVAHWALDETSGSEAADTVGDATGSFWPGGAGPEPGLAAPSSLHGTAYGFDGSSAISLGEVDALAALTDDFSLAAWVWPDGDRGVNRILAVDGWGDGGLVFGLTETDGRRAMLLTTVGVKDYVLPVVVPTDRWSHLAVVVDAGATARFYIDGELRGTVAHHLSGSATTGAWWIGSNGTDGFWSGGLDDVRVYSGALGQADLRSLADVSPPMGGWVTAPEQPWTDAEQLTLWWPGFFDPGSAVQGYQINLGRTEGADDLLTAIAGGAEQTAELKGLALPDGTVHVTVTATDGVGLQTTVLGTVEVDTSLPPLLGAWAFDRDLPFGEPVAVEDELERAERFTLAAWISPSTTGPMTVFGSDEGGWSLASGGDGDDLVFMTQGLEQHVVETELLPDTWAHVAVAFDRFSDATIYVDGEVVGVGLGTVPAWPSTSGFAVGGQAAPWQGGLDDVRLYDGVLRPDQVRALFEGEPADTGDPGDSGTPADSGAGSGDTAEADDTHAGGDGGADLGKDAGCGCAAGGWSGRTWLWLGLLVLVGRRRGLDRASHGHGH